MLKGFEKGHLDFRYADFGRQLLPLPPLSEQAAIVEYLDRATGEIDDAIARARRQIELMQEYRTRLIADVVTGQGGRSRGSCGRRGDSYTMTAGD